MQIHINEQRGVLLVEMIIAIGVLSLAVIGPVSLAVKSLQSTRDAAEEMRAIYLASEAIEIVHNLRDNNSARDYANERARWLDGIASTTPPLLCAGANGCIVDPGDRTGAVAGDMWGTNVLAACQTAGCGGGIGEDWMYYNPSTRLYRQHIGGLGAEWENTRIRRRVQVSGISAAPERVRIEVTVEYPAARGYRTVKLSDEMYNWFPSL